MDSLQNLGSVPALRSTARCGGIERLFATVSNSWLLSPAPKEHFVHWYLFHNLCSKQPLRSFTGSRESLTDGFCPSWKQQEVESYMKGRACQGNFPSAPVSELAAPVASHGLTPARGHPADRAAGMPWLCQSPFRLGAPGVCLQNGALL